MRATFKEGHRAVPVAFAVSARLRRDETVDTFAAVLEIQGEKLDVWVKRPRPELADNEALTKALIEWGETQVELDHEHVVPVLEAGRSEQGAYVIQERVDGVALAAVLAVLRRKKRALSPAHALTVAARLCDGAAYLAKTLPPGHGALGPAHVYLGYQGEVRVADPQMTRLLMPVGKDLLAVKTQPYLPPEVREGAVPTPQADVYALALVILEMAIGHPVWTGARMTVDDALQALTDFTQLGQASPDLARDLRKILAPCVSPNPDVRPAHAGRVSEQMEELLKRYHVVSDDLALGTFVESILPPGDGEEAPTMMVDPAEVERLAKAREAKADWNAASVLINPEIERQAAEFVAKRHPSAAERRKSSVKEAPPPERASSSNGGGELFAASVDLSSASPQSLQAAAQAAAKSAEEEPPPPPAPEPRAESQPANSPMAPSVRRDRAKSALDVTKRAVEKEKQNTADRRVIGVVGLVLLAAFVLGIVMLYRTGNEPPPQIRLIATSVPSGASLFVGGKSFGRTPVDIDVDLQTEPYQLRFELDGHEAHQVSIGTQESELRYEARLISQ